MRLPSGSEVKNLPSNAEDTEDAALILGSGRSPGGGNANPVQQSYLENSMDKGAWWAYPWDHKRVGQRVDTNEISKQVNMERRTGSQTEL